MPVLPEITDAYKSWCAKALNEHGAFDSHVKSAVQALRRYWDSK
jgi:hypothetical protein